MTAVPGEPAGRPLPGGRGLKGLSKANPKLVLGGAAVGIVVLVALVSKKSAVDSGAGMESTSTTGQINPSNGGYYDSTANDVYNSLMGQFVTLQQQVAELTPGASTPTPAPTTTTPAVKSAAQLAAEFAARHALYLKTPAGIARAKANREAAYRRSPAGLARAKLNRENAARRRK